MLVLTRKQCEKIQIGDDITITILRTKGKAVRVGIEAPETVTVLRGELAEKRRAESAGAASLAKTKPAAAGPAVREERAEPTEAWAAQRPDAGPRVALERVPRSRVATVLPKMLGAESFSDGGPLRAMLGRRAAQPRA